MLCNKGATYVTKASLCDVFVTYKVLNEDGTETVIKKNTEVINQLDNSDLIASVYINHNDYDILNIEALRLSTYLTAEDKSNSLTAAYLLKKYTKDINDLNSVHMKNIF